MEVSSEKPRRGWHPSRLKRIRSRQAFTLIECLTVLSIITVLAGIVIGIGHRASEAGKIAKAKAELAGLSAALEGYRRQHGDYPRTKDASVLLQSLIGRKGPVQTTINGRSHIDLARFSTADGLDPFTSDSAALIDPWERRYIYAYTAASAGWKSPSYVLFSPGPDGVATDFPPDGLKTPDYFSALKDGRSVNVDNLYANE